MKYEIKPPTPAPIIVEIDPGDCFVPEVNPERFICAFVQAAQGPPLEPGLLVRVFSRSGGSDDTAEREGIHSRMEVVKPTWPKDLGLRKTDRLGLREHLAWMAAQLVSL